MFAEQGFPPWLGFAASSRVGTRHGKRPFAAFQLGDAAFSVDDVWKRGNVISGISVCVLRLIFGLSPVMVLCLL